jgi:hypothetical protein
LIAELTNKLRSGSLLHCFTFRDCCCLSLCPALEFVLELPCSHYAFCYCFKCTSDECRGPTDCGKINTVISGIQSTDFLSSETRLPYFPAGREVTGQSYTYIPSCFNTSCSLYNTYVIKVSKDVLKVRILHMILQVSNTALAFVQEASSSPSGSPDLTNTATVTRILYLATNLSYISSAGFPPEAAWLPLPGPPPQTLHAFTSSPLLSQQSTHLTSFGGRRRGCKDILLDTTKTNYDHQSGGSTESHLPLAQGSLLASRRHSDTAIAGHKGRHPLLYDDNADYSQAVQVIIHSVSRSCATMQR